MSCVVRAGYNGHLLLLLAKMVNPFGNSMPEARRTARGYKRLLSKLGDLSLNPQNPCKVRYRSVCVSNAPPSPRAPKV